MGEVFERVGELGLLEPRALLRRLAVNQKG